MKPSSRNVGTVSACVFALVFPLAGMAQEGHSHAAKSPTTAKTTGSGELHRIMLESHKQPMTMTGDVDQDFASMMSMHHEQGIKMIDVELKHGKDPALKALAQKMKDEQRKEIGELASHKPGH